MSEPVATPANAPTQKEKPRKSTMREIIEWVLTLLAAVAIAMAIRTFWFEPVRVDGFSMLNTLDDREFMIATKWRYLWNDPERFDVVICKYPDRTETFVKRVVGLPGETVELRNGELYINGEFVAQNFERTPSTRDFGPTIVPEGHFFVMGDNRDHSNDSRSVGALPRDMIRGHVRYVVFPFNKIRAIPDIE